MLGVGMPTNGFRGHIRLAMPPSSVSSGADQEGGGQVRGAGHGEPGTAQLSLACAALHEARQTLAARHTPHWDRGLQGHGLSENREGVSEPGGPPCPGRGWSGRWVTSLVTGTAAAGPTEVPKVSNLEAGAPSAILRPPRRGLVLGSETHRDGGCYCPRNCCPRNSGLCRPPRSWWALGIS